MDNDNVIPMSSRAIDLPVSPFRTTSAEGELMHAPVVATLMQGKTIAGRLIGVDGPRAIISLETRDKRRVYVRFVELRYLNFITRNPVNRGRHPLQKDHAADILMPRNAQEFRITFTDQKVLTGRTRSSFVDRIGLHLFQLVDSSHVTRLFIPAQAVARYYIGERRDQPPGEVASVHTEKPAPRRRKADRTPDAAAVDDTHSLCAALSRRGESGGDSLISPKRIGEMLVEDGIISQDQLERALEIQRRGKDDADRIGEILVASAAASAEQIYTALAHKFGMPFVLLRNFFVQIECLNLVPADIARRYTLVPLLVHQDRLIVAMDDPANTEPLTLLRFMTQHRIEPVIATRCDIEWAISKYYGDNREKQRPSARSATRAERNRKTMEKAVASFIANTISDAVSRNAADIRFIAQGERAEMLFRIDGDQVRIRRFSRIIMPAIFAHLRAMARIAPPSDEHRGQARILDGHEIVDARIAVDERSDGTGEVKIELVRSGARIATLDDTGLSPDDLGLLREGLGRRGRLLVIAGPPDSHRARTMYAALRELKEAGRRVATAEWPVSYYLSGIEQAHPGGEVEGFPLLALEDLRGTGIGGLLLGELGTAALLNAAIDTALRGISVVAKLEAATAAHALDRLMDLASERAELGSALSGILVQHKVRVNCRYCLVEEHVSPEIRATLGVGADEVFYHGAGCDDCRQTGFNGFQPVFEFLPNSLELAALVESGAPCEQIVQWTRNSNSSILIDNALRLARLRRIPFAEAVRLQVATNSS
ncbi:MAG: ATPase, T2SS/T4P/T4SS family [Gammaproteobacteria bacterium]|jgi:type IV pilus assembly protein PilB|nr:ATPase, T2SS/T4P/T4SS family [Gammaproteobacteria bacterium]